MPTIRVGGGAWDTGSGGQRQVDALLTRSSRLSHLRFHTARALRSLVLLVRFTFPIPACAPHRTPLLAYCCLVPHQAVHVDYAAVVLLVH